MRSEFQKGEVKRERGEGKREKGKRRMGPYPMHRQGFAGPRPHHTGILNMEKK